jgi:hypothetical protein
MAYRCVAAVFLVYLTVLFALPLEAQIIKGAVIAGCNLSQVDGDEVYGFNKLGANVGAAAIIPFSDHWEVSIEALYSQKGSYQKAQRDDSISGQYKLKLNYLDVPVLVHYNDKNRMWFGLGFSYGRLASVEEWEHGQQVETTDINGPYDRDDFNAIGDFRFTLYQRLKFNVRYAYSISKIRTREFTPPGVDPWTRNQYNNFWSFRLIYVINEKQSERIRKENSANR